jgi:hypothetical protein
MADSMLATIRQMGDTATGDAIKALDDRAREGIERLTTDTARAVAGFLYDRDADILQAAQVEPDEAAYRRFPRPPQPRVASARQLAPVGRPEPLGERRA